VRIIGLSDSNRIRRTLALSSLPQCTARIQSDKYEGALIHTPSDSTTSVTDSGQRTAADEQIKQKKEKKKKKQKKPNQGLPFLSSGIAENGINDCQTYIQ